MDNTLLNLILVFGIFVPLALIVREVVLFIREFEVRLFRGEDGKWWVSML